MGSIFAKQTINLKTDAPDGIELGKKKMKKALYAITMLLFVATSCHNSKVVMVTCPPSGARIEIDGKYAGDQRATANFGAFAHVTVSAPKYFSQSFTLNSDSKNVTEICLKEDRDDSWDASVPASDLANKNIRFRATADKSEDEIWYTLIRYASDYFEDFTVNDKGAGWAKSTWVIKEFSKCKVRSRLEIKRNPGDKKEFTLVLSSQITYYKNCYEDQCYQPWDRILKMYAEVPSALATAVQ